MNDKEFQIKLRATFRVEANEHMAALSAGLIELETTEDPAARQSLVETVFREVHSLKGAARAVNEQNVERICHALESIFAHLKRTNKTIPETWYDELHAAYDALAGELNGMPIAAAALRELCEKLDAMPNGSVSLTSRNPAPPKRDPLDTTTTAPATVVANSLAPGAPPAAPLRDDSGVNTPAVNLGTRKSRSSSTVRVESNRLDDLFDQAESLLAAKSFASEHLKAINEIRALLASIQASNAHLDSEPGNDVELAVRRAESLSASAEEFSRSFSTLVNGLVESMKDVLMLSFDTVLAPFAKVVRDLGRTQGKEIELRTVGESVEADKRVLEGLKEPLTHLVRNAADHGIEVPAVRIAAGKSPRGLIEIAITRHDDRVQIRVADDGNGVDTERLRVGEDSVGCGVSALELIFRSGISTRDIADEVSGRGLGLAIVRERIESLGGAVSVQTTPGKGTAFLLDLPTKLATFRGTFIALDDQIFVIPTRSVERVFRLQPDTVFPIKGKPMLSVSGRAVPLVNLHTVFAGPGVSAKRGTTCVLVQTGGSRIALEVERVIEEREIVVKNLGPQIKRARYFSGATIIESGKVVPVLKVAGLLGESSRQEPAAAEESKPPKQSVAEGKTVLLVEDSVTSRMLLKGLLETAGFRVRTAVNGVEALKLLNQTPFDLVVSDIEMPEMDGVELTEHIRADAQFGGTPVVLVTSLGSAEDIQRGLDAGANAYFPKASFDHERLLETVSGLI